MKSGAFSVSDICQTARRVLCDGFSWFNDEDQLVVEQQIRQVRVFYACVQASRGCPDATFLECRLDFDSSEMWIGNLQVAEAYRLRGLGRELVQVAETISAATQRREINVFPLPRSLAFWRKLGYTAKTGMTRVLSKDVFVGCGLAAWQEGHKDRRSAG